MTTRKLTDEEIAEAILLRGSGAQYKDLAARYNVGLTTVHDALRGRVKKRGRWEGPSLKDITPLHPSHLAQIERDRRLAAPPRDLTAILMGDPPIGYSALERRT